MRVYTRWEYRIPQQKSGKPVALGAAGETRYSAVENHCSSGNAGRGAECRAVGSSGAEKNAGRRAAATLAETLVCSRVSGCFRSTAPPSTPLGCREHA